MGSLDHIVVSHGRLRGRLLDLMRQAIPASWLLFVRGPQVAIGIPVAGARSRSRFSCRPVALRIGGPLVLTKRLSIPRVGRAEIRHAIELMIKTETPFDPSELMVDAFRLDELPGDEQCRYQVRMLPRAQIDAALKQLRVRGGAIAQVNLEGHERPFHRAAFDRKPGAALRRHFVWAAPLVVVIWLGTTLVISEFTYRQATIAALQFQAETESALLRRAGTVLAELREADEKHARIDDQFQKVPPTSEVLRALKATLPATLSVSRIEYRDGQYRLSVSAPDVLGDLGNLQEALLQPVALDGPVVDSAAGLQQATIALAVQQP